MLPRILAGWLALTPVFVDAQTASTPAKSITDKSPEPIVLSVFEVPADADEYRAAHTTSGTAYNAPIQDLPIQVNVLTQQFIRDIGATDMLQALEYMGGAQPAVAEAHTGAPEFGYGSGQFYQIRGMQAEAITKNGYARQMNIDAVSVSRVDMISGPGGGPYGQKAMGGAINALGEIPRPRRSTYFRTTVGDHDYVRGEAKFTGPVPRYDKIRYALGVSQTHNHSRTMFDWYDKFVIDGVVSISLTPSTQLRLEHEFQKQSRSNLRGGALFDDNALRTANGEPWGIRGLDGRDPTRSPVLDVRNARYFRFDGPDTWHHLNFRASSVVLTHSFTPDLQVKLLAARDERHERRRGYSIAIRRDTDSQVAPAWRSDPAFRALLRPGFIGTTPVNQVLEYSQGAYQPDSFLIRPVYRMEFYYNLDLPWVKSAFNGGITSEHYTFGGKANVFYVGHSNNNAGVGNANAAILNSQTREQFLGRYRSLTDFTSIKRWNDTVPTVLEPTYRTTHFFDRTIFLNHNAHWFGGRLFTIAGVLDIRSDRQQFEYNTRDDSLNAVTFMRAFPTEGRKPMFSATYKLTPTLNVYFNGSRSFTPEYSPRDGNMIPFQGSFAVNKEIGLKWEGLQRRVLLSASVFSNTRTQWPFSVPFAYNNDPEDNDSLPGFGANVLRDYEAKGFELKLDYRIMPGLTVNGQFNQNPGEVSNMTGLVQPTREGVNVFAGVPVPIPDLNSVYVGSNNVKQSKRTFRGFLRYDVREGRLKGLWSFLGARYDGSRETVNISTSQTAATISAPVITVSRASVKARKLYDFNFGYRHRVDRYRLNYQINIVNVLNNDDWYDTYWNPPRTVRFSTDVEF
jgi:outer membrane receptor protein involved in Fe transport